MKEFILKESVLNDDVLYLPNNGYKFKGNYIAIIKFYTFQNAWSNKENLIKFRSIKSLDKYLNKYYKYSFDFFDI